MVDVVLGTGIFERVRPDRLAVLDRKFDISSGRTDISGRGEVGAVVCQHDVDLVGDRFDKRPEEVPCDPASGFLMQFDEGELRGSINGDQQVELTLFRADLGDVDVEVAKWIGFELPLVGSVSLDIRQAGNAMALKTAVQ